jgi:hypothetical protein
MRESDRQHRIEAAAQAAIADHFRRSSLTYLECCIALMLTHMSREEVAEVLAREADMVRDLG